jgi:hypothetical protein
MDIRSNFARAVFDYLGKSSGFRMLLVRTQHCQCASDYLGLTFVAAAIDHAVDEVLKFRWYVNSHVFLFDAKDSSRRESMTTFNAPIVLPTTNVLNSSEVQIANPLALRTHMPVRHFQLSFAPIKSPRFW